MEVTQTKGDAETDPYLSTQDEFANFERWDFGNMFNPVVPKQQEMLQYEYARSALGLGLKLEDKLGVNPFKFSMIGSTDTHTALSTFDEDNFFGKMPSSEPSPERWNEVFLVNQDRTPAVSAWQRPPSADELEGFIREHLREEVYYREAMALGLDKDDIIIRRRLRQKLEFISEDVAAQAEPTDEQLRADLKANPEAFRVERRFTFRQVYLNPERRRESLTHDAAQLLVQLNQTGAKADISLLGDSFLLEHDFDAVPASEVAKQFGEKFAVKLNELQPGQWQGPVESGYGVHLVFITERTTGRVPALEEIRDVMRREWANMRRLGANELFYQRLLKRYTVTGERPQPAGVERRVTEVQR